MATAGQNGGTSKLPEEDEIQLHPSLDQDERNLHKIAETHLGVRRYDLLEYAERADEDGQFSVNDYIAEIENETNNQFDAQTINYTLSKASNFTDKLEGVSIREGDYSSNIFRYKKNP